MRAHLCVQSIYTRSKAQVNVSELIHNVLASTTIDDDLRSYEEAMLNRHKKQCEAAIMEESNFIIRNKTGSPRETGRYI
jgi:hypothetical protein